ncbi:AAA family ATPase [Candidatus Nomurabacteria bacterium]|nr:MAG: AAA family ATPase [Candidatus Nomurabacteria bacterium]
MDSKQVIEILREALQNARKKIAVQADLIDTISSSPLEYCVVVKTGNKTLVERLPRPSDFSLGKEVRLSISHPDYLKNLNTKGKVTKEIDLNGCVQAEFENGYKNNFDIGGINKSFELELTEEVKEEKETITIVINGQFLEINKPLIDVEPGDVCTLSSKTKQIVNRSATVTLGPVCVFRKLMDENHCEVEISGTKKVVFSGKINKDAESGDHIVLDPSSSIILKNLGKSEEDFSLNEELNVSWDEIGGLHKAKELMIELVELPFKNPDLFKFYNRKMPKGVLLYGPPGCGKTMLGKAVATSLAKNYDKKGFKSGFIYIKGPEILNKYVGNAEETIREIFDRARKHNAQYNYPATLFIDEAEAILSKRGSGVSSDVEKTIVPMFLTEMDGLEDSGAFIILATNRPDMLDPAIVRDGRIDRKVKITRPDQKSAGEIFLKNIKKIPKSNSAEDDLSKVFVEKFFSEDLKLCDIKYTESEGHLFLHHICNGAMIVSAVDMSISNAMKRDLANNTKTGIQASDVEEAVENLYKQNLDLNHNDEIAEIIEDSGKRLITFSRHK